MTRQEFFETIKNNCNNEIEYLIELLKLRGFLFDTINGELCLNDSSYREDAKFLSELLTQCRCGSLIKKRVILNAGANSTDLEKIFVESPPIEGVYEAAGGNSFKHRMHGESVPAELLDNFIARYIKAIAACNVLVSASCDGNHPGMNKIFIMTKERTSRIWHKLICTMCLAGRYNINWNSDCTAVEFDDTSKYSTYYEMNRAAEYLYANRQEIRGILNTVMKEMAGSFFLEHSAEEIEYKFIKRASELFCNSLLLQK